MTLTISALESLTLRMRTINADISAAVAKLATLAAERTECRDAAKAMGITYASFDQMVPEVGGGLDLAVAQAALPLASVGDERSEPFDVPEHLRVQKADGVLT